MARDDGDRATIRIVDRTIWTGPADADDTASLARALESGCIVVLPGLAFALTPDEQRFLDPRWSNGADKNVSLGEDGSRLRGAAGDDASLAALASLLARFREAARRLVASLVPRYASAIRLGRTSYRPVEIAGRPASWRGDDTRVHVDAFPTRPTGGARTLRVFTNVSPAEPRVWHVGEPFAALATRFLPRLRRPWPGSALLLEWLSVTVPRRSEYDHYMLGLHDAMKRDLDYAREVPPTRVAFAPGTTWICFSDQVAHAAVAGCFALEQTLHLPVAAQLDPETAPLRVLERALGRPLA